jgi:hypothetical protein
LTLALAVATAISLRGSLPSGDEPHYLVITQSLLQDGDLRIENNHQARDYRAYFDGTIDPQSLRRGADGQIYPVHMPGVSVVVLPLFAIFGYRGAQATIVVAAAMTGALVWLIGWITTRDRRSAWFAWAAIVGSTTFLAQSPAVFPDLPAATATAVAALAIAWFSRGGRPTPGVVAGATTMIAVLPFLHTRFAVMSGGLGLILMLVLARRLHAASRRERAASALAFAVPAMVSLAAWFGYFWLIYGTPNPTAPYGSLPESSLRYVPGGVLGLAFDQQFGLLAYSPVLAFAVAPLILTRTQHRSIAVALLALVAAYAAAVATYWMWWAGGPAPPARFLAAALPLLAVPLAEAWRFSEARGRQLAGLLVTVSVVIALIAIFADEGRLVANDRTARALWLEWLGGLADLPRLWPSFFWRLDPSDLSTEWLFARDALIWLLTFVGVGVLCRRIRSIAVSVWWIPVSVMIAGGATSSLNRSPFLMPALAQLDVLSAATNGNIWKVAPGEVRRAGPEDLAFEITVPRTEMPGSTTAEWLVLPMVPAGRYNVVVTLKRPRTGGTLDVRRGRAPAPLAVFSLTGQSVQTFPIVFDAAVNALWFVPNDVLASSAASLELVRVP